MSKAEKKEKHENVDWLYEYMVQYITSAMFRSPIKEFVEENCIYFEGEEENNFNHTELHNKFKKLIEQLLQNMLTDLGANDSQFVLACKRGLHSKENKKYFEQLIACDHFLYFKNMMVKKNLQLEEQAYKLLHENMMKKSKQSIQTIMKDDKDYNKLKEKKEKIDKIAENEMNKVVDEEKQKLAEIPDSDMNEFAKKKDLVVKNKGAAKPAEKDNKPEEEEISLYNNNLKAMKLNPIVPKSSDISAKETVKQLEIADKDKKPLYVSPVKKVMEEKVDVPKIEEKKDEVIKTKDSKTVGTPTKTVGTPTKTDKTDKIDKKASVITTKLTEPKIEYTPQTYVGPDISKMNFDDESHNEMKKKLESDLADSMKDSKQLESQYDKLQKDKENKLKEYRDMIMKMKKDKRNVNKVKEVDSNNKEINEEVKKKIEQRQSLGDKLKNNK